MKTTMNEAIELLKQGKENESYEMAKQDEGMNPNITKDQWLKFGHQAIERRQLESLITYPEAYYS